MISLMIGLALLSPAGLQEPQKATWRTDVRPAREAALREGRPCVLFLYLDSK